MTKSELLKRMSAKIDKKPTYKILSSHIDEKTGLTVNVYDSVSEETKEFQKKMKHLPGAVYNSHNTDNGSSFNFNV